MPPTTRSSRRGSLAAKARWSPITRLVPRRRSEILPHRRPSATAPFASNIAVCTTCKAPIANGASPPASPKEEKASIPSPKSPSRKRSRPVIPTDKNPKTTPPQSEGKKSTPPASPKPAKSPSQKTSPPSPTPMATQLTLYIAEAAKRTTLIRAAYASSSLDYRTLGNPDISLEHQALVTAGQDHAPYTVEACRLVGSLMGELGRALDTAQKGAVELGKVLEREVERARTEGEEEREKRREWEREWWVREKRVRLEEMEKPRKRKRRGKK